MARTTDMYDSRVLAEVVRQTAPVKTFFRDTFFKNVATFPTKTVDIDIVKGDRKMAAFVHPRIGGKVLKDNGYQTKQYTPPLVAPTTVTTADMLYDRLPGENLYSGMTPAERAMKKIQEDYIKLDDSVTRREEWMCVTAIVYGKVPIIGEGINDEIDFGLSNTETLTGTAQWGKSAAKPLDNLDAWKLEVSKNGFANADMVIMGKSAYAAFIGDAEVQKRLDNRNLNLAVFQPRELPSGAEYMGRLTQPMLDIYRYSEIYEDDWTDPTKPAVKPLVPDNAVILISSGANYTMAYGLCTYLDEKTEQWVTAETPRALRSYIEHNPDRRMLESQSHPLPIPDKADSWFTAFVC